MESHEEIMAVLRQMPDEKQYNAKWTAESLFKSFMVDRPSTSTDTARGFAKTAIQASALFWEEWVVAVMSEEFVSEKQATKELSVAQSVKSWEAV